MERSAAWRWHRPLAAPTSAGVSHPNLAARVRGRLPVLCGCWNGSVARLKPCPWAPSFSRLPAHASSVRVTGTCISSSAFPQTAASVLYLVRFHHCPWLPGTARRYLRFPLHNAAPARSVPTSLNPDWERHSSRIQIDCHTSCDCPAPLLPLIFASSLRVRLALPCLIRRAISRHHHWPIAICCTTASGPIAASASDL